MSEELYYIQRKPSGYLGNSPFWWAKDGKGYTAYILGAERFTKDAAEKLISGDSEKWAMFKCFDIDARLHLIFDIQDEQALGTDKSCGWFKYANTRAEPELNHEDVEKAVTAYHKAVMRLTGHGENNLNWMAVMLKVIKRDDYPLNHGFQNWHVLEKTPIMCIASLIGKVNNLRQFAQRSDYSTKVMVDELEDMATILNKHLNDLKGLGID